MAAVSTFPSPEPQPPTAAVHHPQQVWRPAERAREIAEEFCDTSSSWKTLPPRLERLGRRLQAWNDEASSSSSGGEEEERILRMCAFTLDPASARRDALTAAILASPQPEILFQQFESLFRASLTHRDAAADDEDGQMVDEELDEIFVDEPQLFRNLRATAWVGGTSSSLLYHPLMNAIQFVVHAKVVDYIAGDFETPDLYKAVQQWKDDVAVPWLIGLLVLEEGEHSSVTPDEIEQCLTRLTAESFCVARMEEIFDIVTSYPDSYTAVQELCQVLPITDMYTATGHYLRDSLIRRLNHPGADTSQIIDVYINTIKVLRLMDPSDRLLQVVAEPVRTYLRSRSDTVRCIITSLTDAEAGGDLYQELRRQDVKLLENVTVDSDDEEEPPDMHWQPPPSLNKPKGTFLQSAGAGSGGGKGGDSDILAMLVSIYGSKELFVNEYRLMLADKLLANLDYNTDKERHTLELLKLRFGEASMNAAEVMIKDIDDSVRSNKNIHDSLTTSPPMRRRTSYKMPGEKPAVDAAMISHIFWPKMQNEQLKHHPRIQVELDEFSHVYAEQKNPRKLIWMNQLGSVQVELDVVEAGPDGQPQVETKEFTCSPLLATLISHFEDKPTWTAEALSNETGIPEHVIRKRMTYWITNRVVAFSDGDSSDAEYTLASRAQRQAHGGDLVEHEHDDDEHASEQRVSAAAQHQEEMEVFESYIVVMLTSLQHGAPLDKIHNMLKMMVSGSETKYNKTPQQLSAFLQHLCRQEKLECGPDGTYKLVKKSKD